MYHYLRCMRYLLFRIEFIWNLIPTSLCKSCACWVYYVGFYNQEAQYPLIFYIKYILDRFNHLWMVIKLPYWWTLSVIFCDIQSSHYTGWTFYASIYLKLRTYKLLFSFVNIHLLISKPASLSGPLYKLYELQFYLNNSFNTMLVMILFPTNLQVPIRPTHIFFCSN